MVLSDGKTLVEINMSSTQACDRKLISLSLTNLHQNRKNTSNIPLFPGRITVSTDMSRYMPAMKGCLLEGGHKEPELEGCKVLVVFFFIPFPLT